VSTCLKIGHRLLNGDQIISALVQHQILETLVGQVLLDDVIQQISLSHQDLFYALVGSTAIPIPEDFEQFLAQWCDRQNMTPAYFNEVMVRKLRVEKFKHLYFAAQVESEFLRIKSDFDQVEYSLIQTADLALAQELYFQLRDDQADFAQLAQRYSLGSECQTGGWVGPIPLSTLPVEVTKLFGNKQIGTVYAPVAIGDRYWVVRLEGLMVARLTEAIRANLIERLYARWLQSQVQALIATPGAIVYGKTESTESIAETLAESTEVALKKLEESKQQ
jgi:parvulin-like peptidyl-prolyl isomerase